MTAINAEVAAAAGKPAPLGAMAAALRAVGKETKAELIERLMRQAIEKHSISGPSIAQFSRELVELNNAAVIWELFASERGRVLAQLYERTIYQMRLERAPPKSPAPPPPAPSTEEKARMAQVGMAAVLEVATAALLKTVRINDRPIGEVCAGEARSWARERGYEMRFVLLLTEGMADETLIGDACDEARAQECRRIARAAANE